MSRQWPLISCRLSISICITSVFSLLMLSRWTLIIIVVILVVVLVLIFKSSSIHLHGNIVSIITTFFVRKYRFIRSTTRCASWRTKVHHHCLSSLPIICMLMKTLLRWMLVCDLMFSLHFLRSSVLSFRCRLSMEHVGGPRWRF